MSVLTLEQIKSIIEAETPEWVKIARKEATRLHVHFNGDDRLELPEFLFRLNRCESDCFFDLSLQTALEELESALVE